MTSNDPPAAPVPPGAFDFYQRLPACESFADVTRPEVYAPLPDDWSLIIGDVESSTAAIARGQYKDVNLVGSSLLIAIFNALGHSNLPFVFGGDGATLTLPDSALPTATPALLATRRMARDGFGLVLRLGVVPMRDVRAAGGDVRVARVNLSERFALAAFWGDGLAWAEKIVKDPAAGARYRLEAFVPPPDNRTFDGLECRWRGVPSEQGETLALLVLATAPDAAAQARIYTETLARLREIFGEHSGGHPISVNQLQIATKLSDYDGETKVRRSQAGPLRRALFRLRIRIEGIIGDWLMRNRIKTLPADWGRYKEHLVRHSDYRKFDCMLRMVLAATPAQRAALTEWLDARQRAGELAYGMHIAQEALVTCLIFEREGGHLHFIDGANGGYARASADLKARLLARAGAA